MGDALLGFLFAAEGDEGFALEVEEVVFADQLGGGKRSTREDVGEFAGDMGIVIGSIASADLEVNCQFCSGKERLAENFDLRGLRAFLPRSGGRFPGAARKS